MKRKPLGQAADLARLSKRAFIEIMGMYGFSLFSKSEEDLLSDIAYAWTNNLWYKLLNSVWQDK